MNNDIKKLPNGDFKVVYGSRQEIIRVPPEDQLVVDRLLESTPEERTRHRCKQQTH